MRRDTSATVIVASTPTVFPWPRHRHLTGRRSSGKACSPRSRTVQHARGFAMNRTFGLGDLARSGRGAKTRYSCLSPTSKASSATSWSSQGLRNSSRAPFSATPGLRWRSTRRPTRRRGKSTSVLRGMPSGRDTTPSPVAQRHARVFDRKKPPPPPTAAKSGFVSLRQLESGGTRYFVRLTGFAVPLGMSLFFFLPPVCSTFANGGSRKRRSGPLPTSRLAAPRAGKGQRSRRHRGRCHHIQHVLHTVHSLRPDLAPVRFPNGRLRHVRFRGHRHLRISHGGRSSPRRRSTPRAPGNRPLAPQPRQLPDPRPPPTGVKLNTNASQDS